MNSRSQFGVVREGAVMTRTDGTKITVTETILDGKGKPVVIFRSSRGSGVEYLGDFLHKTEVKSNG